MVGDCRHMRQPPFELRRLGGMIDHYMDDLGYQFSELPAGLWDEYLSALAAFNSVQELQAIGVCNAPLLHTTPAPEAVHENVLEAIGLA